MSAIVEKLVDQVKALPKEQYDEFLAWLAEYELQHPDAWDQQMERDSLPGGRLQDVIERARNDIAAGRTKPLDGRPKTMSEATMNDHQFPPS